MKIIQEHEDYLRRHIRDILAINPLASVRSMQEMIEKRTERSISDKYLSKLMQKIRRQVIVESDRKQVNERLSEVRERNRAHIEYLERILLWKPEYYWKYGMDEPKLKDKMSAIKLVSQLDLALLKAEFLVGMFESKGVQLELTRSQSTTLKVGLRN